MPIHTDSNPPNVVVTCIIPLENAPRNEAITIAPKYDRNSDIFEIETNSPRLYLNKIRVNMPSGVHIYPSIDFTMIPLSRERYTDIMKNAQQRLSVPPSNKPKQKSMSKIPTTHKPNTPNTPIHKPNTPNTPIHKPNTPNTPNIPNKPNTPPHLKK